MSTDTITQVLRHPQHPRRGRWRIDPTRSSVEFRTRTLWGLATVKGHFERYDGTLDLERSPAIELTIDADSLNTKNDFRDRHLRSADFFDVEEPPRGPLRVRQRHAGRRHAEGSRPAVRSGTEHPARARRQPATRRRRARESTRQRTPITASSA